MNSFIFFYQPQGDVTTVGVAQIQEVVDNLAALALYSLVYYLASSRRSRIRLSQRARWRSRARPRYRRLLTPLPFR
jgi:hypothetical protein